MIGSIIAWGWALVVPYAGPVVARALPWLTWLPPATALKRGLRAASYIAALVLGGWITAKALALWQGDMLTERQAKAKAAEAIAAAVIEAKQIALAEREQAIADRERQLAADQDAIEQLEQEMRDARGTTADGRVAVFGVNDGWLRAWMARGY